MRSPSRRRARALTLAAVLLAAGSPFAFLQTSVAEPGGPTATASPSIAPSAGASDSPSTGASDSPTGDPSTDPTDGSTVGPSADPSADARADPTADPTAAPSTEPTAGSALGGVLGGDLLQAQDQDQVQDQQEAQVDPADVLPTAYPGLPPLTGSQWDGVGTVGLTQVARAKQYLRVPASALAADVDIQLIDPPPDGFISGIDTSIKGYVVSPPGSEHPYGDFPPFRARMLAFGILPIEATVHIDQLRDADGLPVPISGHQPGLFDENFFQKLPDAALSGQVQVRVSDLTVDGVPVDVGSSCRASSPSQLDLVGTGYWSAGDDLTFWTLASNVPTPETILTPEQVKRDYYSVTGGGLLRGTIDVPTFTGCVGPSGDLSRLVSNTVSAQNQPISIRQSPNFNCFPPQINTTCEIPDPFPYPTS